MDKPPADPVELAAALIRCDSVTPRDGGALAALARFLDACGFHTQILRFSDAGTPDIDNLYARFGTGRPCLVFAGHTDVVPPGDETRWRHPPFGAEIADGRLYGRGAVDMKGGIAAFAAAAANYIAAHDGEVPGSIAFLITGDEEGPAINGTAKLLDWAAQRGEKFDHCVLGEPTSAETLGDQLKVGRRGSCSFTLTVEGTQGHVAYPHLADNPVRGLATLLDALFAVPLDQGSEHFDPSTLEAVGLEAGTGAWNVIPGTATVSVNCRFNDLWTPETLKAELERRLAAARDDTRHRPDAKGPIRWRLQQQARWSPSFLTADEGLIGLVKAAVAAQTGAEPALSTGGGTSDARFIKDYCPVVELGLVGRTMHGIDENVPVGELRALSAIYLDFIERYFDFHSRGKG
ncbi:MAG: succinyl-diaminopimelate desuccinylase [Flavobacteriaceae bacterium]